MLTKSYACVACTNQHKERRMGKINAKGGLAKLMSATATTQDRFAAAAAVMGANPSGLAVGPSAPVQPAVAASLQPVDKPQAAAETDNDTVWAPIENVADNPYNAQIGRAHV